MKTIWLHIVRFYIRFGLNCYYRQFKVYNTQHIPQDKPVLFLPNHQNALIDPLLIATKSGRFLYFLTRASVFKKPMVSKFLHGLQMLPVYRIRDGWSNLNNNKSIFETCANLLKSNQAIVVFPEGSHHINRTVRPLSKGFTRIVFEALDTYPNTDLQLIPVGINFRKSEDFEDSTTVFFGEPIAAQNYKDLERHEAIVNLKKDVQRAIAELTTDIPAESYSRTLKRLEEHHVDFLDPQSVNQCIRSNFANCVKKPKPRRSLLRPIFRGVLMFCFIVPFIVWRTFVKPKIKEIEFMATFRFAIYITLFPIWFFCLILAIRLLIDVQTALIFGIAIAAISWLYVKKL